MSDALLFVYGSLLTGTGIRDIDVILRRFARTRGEACMPGRMYDLGDYPGVIVPAPPGEYVYGTLFELAHPQRDLPRLDRYEGADRREPARSEFRRYWMEVHELPQGRRRPCWVYLYNGSVRSRRRIRSGRFRKTS